MAKRLHIPEGETQCVKMVVYKALDGEYSGLQPSTPAAALITPLSLVQ